jgi:hypothetical protein
MIKAAIVALAAMSAGSYAQSQSNTAQPSKQEQPPPEPARELDPDVCGTAGRGCASDREKEYMHLGYKLLPDASSSTIANFARACATKPQWRNDCEKNPVLVLKRIGLTPED